MSEAERLDYCFKKVFGEEGGYVNDPDDPGGATKWGVTQSTYNAYRKRHKMEIRHVIEMDRQEALNIYRGYWDAARCSLAKPNLDLVLFDTAINFGSSRAVEFLQIALKVNADRVFGEGTKAAMLKADHKLVAINICHQRMEYRHERVKKAPKSKKFLNGWLNRDKRMLKEAQDSK